MATGLSVAAAGGGRAEGLVSERDISGPGVLDPADAEGDPGVTVDR